jgi:hypothetical protein
MGTAAEYLCHNPGEVGTRCAFQVRNLSGRPTGHP